MQYQHPLGRHAVGVWDFSTRVEDSIWSWRSSLSLCTSSPPTVTAPAAPWSGGVGVLYCGKEPSELGPLSLADVLGHVNDAVHGDLGVRLHHTAGQTREERGGWCYGSAYYKLRAKTAGVPATCHTLSEAIYTHQKQVNSVAFIHTPPIYCWQGQGGPRSTHLWTCLRA